MNKALINPERTHIEIPVPQTPFTVIAKRNDDNYTWDIRMWDPLEKKVHEIKSKATTELLIHFASRELDCHEIFKYLEFKTTTNKTFKRKQRNIHTNKKADPIKVSRILKEKIKKLNK